MDPIVVAAAILTTLLDLEPERAPSGVLFAGLNSRGCSHHVYVNVLATLVNHKMVEPGFQLYLTDLGREKARAVDEAVSGA
jgi:hypothetical protein